MISVRESRESDSKAIREVLVENFPSSAEADLVERLISDGAARISIVAIENETVAGYCMLSEMEAPFRALGLGPVSAARSMRGKGVGSLLVKEGLHRAEAENWEGVFVLGNPEYYGRFGFSRELASGFENPFAGPYFLAAVLGSSSLPASAGEVKHADAFAAFD